MRSFASSTLAEASARTATSNPARCASRAVWKTHISVAAPATSTFSTPKLPAAVVGEDDRRAASPGVFQEGHECGVSAPVALEQRVAVLVAEILEHVDE
jgi:hypothetical protein